MINISVRAVGLRLSQISIISNWLIQGLRQLRLD